LLSKMFPSFGGSFCPHGDLQREWAEVEVRKWAPGLPAPSRAGLLRSFRRGHAKIANGGGAITNLH